MRGFERGGALSVRLVRLVAHVPAGGDKKRRASIGGKKVKGRGPVSMCRCERRRVAHGAKCSPCEVEPRDAVCGGHDGGVDDGPEGFADVTGLA